MSIRSKLLAALGCASVCSATLPCQAETAFTALTQIDWVLHRQSSLDEFDPASGEPLNQERLVLRRARVGYAFEGESAFATAEVEAQGERRLTVAPYEVVLGARGDLPLEEREEVLGEPLSLMASVRLGLMQVPFGYDITEPVHERPVLERTTFARALYPGQRDLGAGLDVEFSVLRVSAAMMNGHPVGEGEFPGLDTTSAKDWVSRFGVELEWESGLAVMAGVSAASGSGLHPGAAPTKDRLNWNDGNENGLVELSELGVVPATPATASQVYDRFALGVDAIVRIEVPVVGTLELRAEAVRAKNLDRGIEPADPVARGRDLRELGWCFGVTQELTRYAEVALRHDVYDPDADARRLAGTNVVPVDARYHTTSVALAAKLKQLRFIAQYDHRDNALGIDSTGAPTRLADDAWTLRGEFHY